MKLSVDLLIETASHLCVAVSVLPFERRWTRDEAIIGGHGVRLYKLLSAVLDQTCQHRRETTFIFARLSFETIVNGRYLMAQSRKEIFDEYVKYSLRHEAKLAAAIEANIASRGGTELPIERRMLNSIERAAERSNVELSEIGNKKHWGVGNLYERAKCVGLDEAYLATFAGPSHHVHGNWHDLLEYHLNDSSDGFVPDLEWHMPRPQVLNALAVLTIEFLQDYFGWCLGDVVGDIEGLLLDLHTRIMGLDSAHEQWLSKC